jgi:hypothetical protein
MKYAWIENERIRDICEGGIPADCYIANVAAYYNTLVPDDAQNGWNFIDGVASAPQIQETTKGITLVSGTEPNVIE